MLKNSKSIPNSVSGIVRSGQLAMCVLALQSPVCAGKFFLTDSVSKIESPLIQEASGLAASPKQDQLLWTLNDSGAQAQLHLMTREGKERGTILLNNAINVDWEDLASFTLGGKSYLLVADTGDNQSVRKSLILYILREPKILAGGSLSEATGRAECKINFTFEDGPRDCEAVAVDSVLGQIILISKRTEPPVIYTLPLDLAAPAGKVFTARRIGVVAGKALAGSLLPYQNQPVGLCISRDRSTAAMVTYQRVFLFSRQPEETWAEAFARPPMALAAHGLKQAESIAFSNDGDKLFTVSEGKHSPIKVYQKSTR